jgi:hypothetical protein
MATDDLISNKADDDARTGGHTDVQALQSDDLLLEEELDQFDDVKGAKGTLEPIEFPVAEGEEIESQNEEREPVSAADADVEPEDDSALAAVRPSTFGDLLKGFGACGFSMLFHAVLLIVLGMLVFENTIKAQVQTLIAEPVEALPEDEPVEIELNEQIETVTEQTLAVFSASPAVGATGPSASMGTPMLDQRLLEQVVANEVFIDAPTIGLPDSVGLIESVPDGEVKGEPRAIVGDYQQAMDRLAQEIIWMLDEGPVLVVWLFDQSNSMKDDQREIRDRMENVYNQLGIVGETNGDALLTAVASYGGGFRVHTQKKPTSNRETIRKAIDSISVDATGKEMMCQAVGQAISAHRKYLGRHRQMALILVTDESGEPDNNNRFLEAAIREAKAAKCKVYVLGRESVFGYPFAYIRWRHPQTDKMHWLEIDRGPETGFFEQLQTDGFRRRYDAFSSGFGPYEQSRLARETNGIFFMLPSIEEDLVGKQNRYRYDLDAMRPFLPDMRALAQVVQDRNQYPLRDLIWKVINDLNPYNPASAKAIELDHGYPLRFEEFVERARLNQIKAIQLLRYMAAAQKALEQGRKHREQEASPRWQANYDLIYAQLIAYQARIYEYGVGLDAFMENWQDEVKKNPPVKSPTEILHSWHINGRSKALTEESKPYIQEATKLLEQVAEDFRGTPWGARAEWELRRGYGVYLNPHYDRPYKEVKDPNPVPKL